VRSVNKVTGGSEVEEGVSVGVSEGIVYCVLPGRILGQIGTKVLRVFLLAIHSHLSERILLTPLPPLEQKWLETAWFVLYENIVYRQV